ncbi:MAG: hypothetical protein ACXAAQ_15040 [Candidatus Thorarchaeota archaeon]|jgi:hypothetical protein
MRYDDVEDLISVLGEAAPHEGIKSFMTDFPKHDSPEVRKAFAQGLGALSRHAGLYGDVDFMRKLHEIPELLNDPLIQDALRSLIPAMIEEMNDRMWDDFHGPWRIIYAFQDIDFIMEDSRMQKAIEESIDIVIESLWEGFSEYLVSLLNQTPVLSMRPEIRVNVAQMCYDMDDREKDRLSRVDEWMSKSIIVAAMGDYPAKVRRTNVVQESEEYVTLFDTYEYPWRIVDVIKDVSVIWNDPRIKDALERAVPRIANGIRESNKPLRIVETLLKRRAMQVDLEGAAWVFRHEEINKAIQDSMDSIIKNLWSYSGTPRLAIQMALSDAGVYNAEVEVPRITRRDDYRTLEKISNIVDLKGWDYVTERIMEQLNADSSYAVELVLAMPLDLNLYLDELNPFFGEFALKLVPLLFPYKPMGYVTAMKLVFEIARKAKGHEWMWEKMGDELAWIEKEASLSIDDFI